MRHFDHAIWEERKQTNETSSLRLNNVASPHQINIWRKKMFVLKKIVLFCPRDVNDFFLRRFDGRNVAKKHVSGFRNLES